jgi:acetyl-CoA carboxylase beta subunit
MKAAGAETFFKKPHPSPQKKKGDLIILHSTGGTRMDEDAAALP